MRLITLSRLCELSHRTLMYFVSLALLSIPAFAGTVSIASPGANSTSISAVRITASTTDSNTAHLEVWDNGYKLGQVSAKSVNGVYVLPNGPHTMTIEAVASSGDVLNKSSVNYKVAEACKNSGSAQCNIDQDGIDNIQSDCDPPPGHVWIANPCGSGIQGSDGKDPSHTTIDSITESGTIPDQNNTTLNGRSVHLMETRGSDPSNALFKGDSPTKTSSVQSHWTLDEYVHLPNPAAHQAFEVDAQYTVNGIWTKFYTECAFNLNSGTGYWAVFDTKTGGWIFLDGKSQDGQTPPKVPCDRSQFEQPWSGSSNPSFSGWHHIVWNFLRNTGGTVTFVSLTFDGNTTGVNFTPKSGTGGPVNDDGNFGALIQLDGADNPDGKFDTVDAYVSEVNLTHSN